MNLCPWQQRLGKGSKLEIQQQQIQNCEIYLGKSRDLLSIESPAACQRPGFSKDTLSNTLLGLIDLMLTSFRHGYGLLSKFSVLRFSSVFNNFTMAVGKQLTWLRWWVWIGCVNLRVTVLYSHHWDKIIDEFNVAEQYKLKIILIPAIAVKNCCSSHKRTRH